MDNSLVITGVICRQPDRNESPAGIPHLYLVLEHKSMQVEAGYNRASYLRIHVVVTGELSRQSHNLMQGSVVRVQGFLNRHQTRSGQAKLVLHAQQIEILS
ncbi:MAG: primosomal replication protein N [Chromatiaceae bacterium]|jgi:primosomal replication protein N